MSRQKCHHHRFRRSVTVKHNNQFNDTYWKNCDAEHSMCNLHMETRQVDRGTIKSVPQQDRDLP